MVTANAAGREISFADKEEKSSLAGRRSRFYRGQTRLFLTQYAGERPGLSEAERLKAKAEFIFRALLSWTLAIKPH